MEATLLSSHREGELRLLRRAGG